MQRRQKEDSDLEQRDSSSFKVIPDVEGRVQHNAHQLEGHRNKRVGPCPKNSMAYLWPLAERTAAMDDHAGGESETQSRESPTGR